MKIETEKLKKLAKTLKELRIQNNLSFREVGKLSGVDISTISRLEEAKGYRINALILGKLAKVYNVNPVSLLKIIGYINDNDVNQYLNIAKRETDSISNNEIEILNENNNSYYPKKFIKLPGLNECKAVEINNRIFLYTETCLYNNELGIFNINNKIVAAFYYILNDAAALKDFFTDSVSMTKENSLLILGKVKAVVDLSVNK
jgi:transcriptional regulator with XRE-family HTH domain